VECRYAAVLKIYILKRGGCFKNIRKRGREKFFANFFHFFSCCFIYKKEIITKKEENVNVTHGEAGYSVWTNERGSLSLIILNSRFFFLPLPSLNFIQ
jgi:hypothetical protein